MRMRFDPAAAFGNYNEERIFRLGRIQSRYPQVVNRKLLVLTPSLFRYLTTCSPHSSHSLFEQGRYSGGPNPTMMACWRKIQRCSLAPRCLTIPVLLVGVDGIRFSVVG
jgi:hypothetical protein